ncbi:MAG: methyl-accepting chemotaxis protein, partial [Firmicutes bacterium]|nr:methyl-accepting chemotaxis protein [Bacillota bacterium]
AIIVATIMVLLGVSTWVTYTQFRKVTEASALDVAAKEATNNALIVNNWLQAQGDKLLALAHTSDMKRMNLAVQIPILEKLSVDSPDLELMFIADRSGITVDSTGGSQDISDREYFQQAMSTGEIYYSEPIVSRASGALVVAIAQPVLRDGIDMPVGIIGATVKLDYLQALADSMSINGSGYGWILDNNMVTLAHPNSAYMGNTDIFTDNEELRDLAVHVLQGEAGIDRVKLQGVTQIVAHAPVEVSGWTVTMVAAEKEVLGQVVRLRDISLLVAVIGVILGGIVAYMIAKYVARPIVRLRDLAEQVATGDLTVKADARSEDELGQLSRAFDSMVGDLRNMVQRVGQSAGMISASSHELSASTQETGASIEEVAATTNEFASAVETMRTEAQEMSSSANEISTMALAGGKSVEEAMMKMQGLQRSIEGLVQVIGSLDDRSQEIGRIVDVITDIADQTNLLALNAAIEAARAGEHGRGFAVVADEVRKLAEQSAEATSEITALIGEIRKETDGAVVGMNKGAQEVGDTFAVVDESNKLLGRILEAVQGIVRQIQDVAEGIEHIGTGSQQMAAATEEQSASIEQVASAAHELNNMAEELNELIARFRV